MLAELGALDAGAHGECLDVVLLVHGCSFRAALARKKKPAQLARNGF